MNRIIFVLCALALIQLVGGQDDCDAATQAIEDDSNCSNALENNDKEVVCSGNCRRLVLNYIDACVRN